MGRPVVAFKAAATALLERYQWARQHGLTFGGDRNLYDVLGYDRVITDRQYRDRYARGGIAGRIVDALPKATWRGTGELIEDEDPDRTTQFEQEWMDLERQLNVWAAFLKADILSKLSTFAVLLIGAPDDLSQELPKGKPGGLLYLSPYSGGAGPGAPSGRTTIIDGAACIHELEADTQNPRFGSPKLYTLRRPGLSDWDNAKPIHWSRIIHVAENPLEDEIYAPPGLERCWNLLDDLDKVTGGGAEAFWLRANQGLHVNVDKDMEMEVEDKAALAEQAAEYQHQLRRIIRTRGVDVASLGSDVANFASPADTILIQIAGATGIPKRILTGSEMGELASSQDRENWRDQVHGRQTGYAGPYMVKRLADRLIEYGYLSTPAEYDVRWPEITTLTEPEKSAGAHQWASTNATQGMPVFTADEIRDKWYGLVPLTPEQIEKDTPEPVEAEEPKARAAMLSPTELATVDTLERVFRASGIGMVLRS